MYIRKNLQKRTLPPCTRANNGLRRMRRKAFRSLCGGRSHGCAQNKPLRSILRTQNARKSKKKVALYRNPRRASLFLLGALRVEGSRENSRTARSEPSSEELPATPPRRPLRKSARKKPGNVPSLGRIYRLFVKLKLGAIGGNLPKTP